MYIVVSIYKLGECVVFCVLRMFVCVCVGVVGRMLDRRAKHTHTDDYNFEACTHRIR